MIRHVVLFTWTEDMTDEMEQQFTAELRALAPTLPGLRSYHAGPDAGIVEGNFDFAVVADFDDADSYLAYRDNAEHRDIISRYSAPRAKSRAAVQYEIDGQ
jgi:heme-degrading monooxygenase HmoA